PVLVVHVRRVDLHVGWDTVRRDERFYRATFLWDAANRAVGAVPRPAREVGVRRVHGDATGFVLAGSNDRVDAVLHAVHCARTGVQIALGPVQGPLPIQRESANGTRRGEETCAATFHGRRVDAVVVGPVDERIVRND